MRRKVFCRCHFHTFTCSEVKELANGEDVDFTLEAPYPTWKEMLQNIKEKGVADKKPHAQYSSPPGKPS
jgi:hypothetical protein